MNKKPRRQDRIMDAAGIGRVLKEAPVGFLALVSEDGSPYGIPVNYVAAHGKIYIHCAAEGRKLDCIRRDPRVSFSAMINHGVSPEKMTNYYESVVCSGRARVIGDDYDAKKAALDLLVEKYAPGGECSFERGSSLAARTSLIEITLEHVTGKVNLPRER
ncbi:MAG: pyridoxamine 5'-phosphate oxidase family protein [Firmicutes bacterium]|nr:pyridoxamine 5'-phosphate oxidase family protein [Bacillota bacterium]